MTVTKPGFKNKAFFEQDAIENGDVVTSRCHGSEISGSQQPWSSKYDRKENEKVVRYDFPMQDCTQKQNGSPFFFPSFDNANGRLCQERGGGGNLIHNWIPISELEETLVHQ